MADVLAISAAVVQFLDIAVRLTLQLSSLYKEVRDVPERLRRLQVDIDQQITIARYVQFTHATFWHNSPPTSSMPIDQPLADYIAIMEQLVEAINVITKPNDIGILHRSWSALRATSKCKEAIVLCDVLEKKKSNITMWLSTANIELSSEIRKLVDGIDKKIDQTLQSTQRQEEAATERDLRSSKLPTLLSELSVNTHSTLSELRNETSSSQQQLLTLTANTEVHVRTLVEQWQELSPTFHEFRDILQHSSYLQQFVREIASRTQDATSWDRQTHVSRNGEAVPRVRRYHSCTCRDVVQASSKEITSFLHFRKTFRQHHFRHCPRRRSAATRLEYLVQIIPPTWLLSHTLHLGFCIQLWNSRTSWKVSPLIIGGSRRVDRDKSPAFQAIRNVRRMEKTRHGIQPIDIQDLQRTLKELFDAQQASIYDEDYLGSTLLFEIMCLYAGPNLDPVDRSLVSMIQFLLDSGCDPNIHRSGEELVPYDRSSYNSWCEIGGTVLDVFATDLMCRDTYYPYPSITTPVVYGMLLDNNAHFSRPLSNDYVRKYHLYYFEYFKQEIEHLKKIEEQHEVCNLSDLMVAIIRRSEADFDRGIAKDSIHEASNANGLTAIHFAVYWPKALRQLIRAGADVNCEDSLGRRPIHLAVGCGQAEAVLILLEADCSLYTPSYSHSLLQESLRQGRGFDHITSQIIDALNNRHTRLANLMSSVLPNYDESREKLRQICIVEIDSPHFFDALAGSDYPVPPAFEVDRDGLGVYDTADFAGTIILTGTLADQLWNGGFHRVNDPSPMNALTPLLQSWYAADFDMVSWFIGKGVSPFIKSRLKSHSGLHYLGARIGYPSNHLKNDRYRFPLHAGLVKQLRDDANMWHDSCRCLCSPYGCTPISIAVKQHRYYRDSAEAITLMLNLSSSLYQRQLYLPDGFPDHIEQLLRILVFEKLDLRHNCCCIGHQGQTTTWETWRLTNSDYSGFEEEFHQTLAGYTSKMAQCGCDIIDKPACAVYRGKCEKIRPRIVM